MQKIVKKDFYDNDTMCVQFCGQTAQAHPSNYLIETNYFLYANLVFSNNVQCFFK